MSIGVAWVLYITCFGFSGDLNLPLNHLYGIGHMGNFNQLFIHGKFQSAIWNTSFWSFLVKFGHKGP